MKLNKKIFFFLLIFLSTFSIENTYSIHHHPRLNVNLLENTEFFGKKRVLILDLENTEILNFLKDFKNNQCEIENHKLEILIKKENKYYYIFDNSKETSLNFFLPHKVSLIGLDGYLKFVDDNFSNLKKYFNLIDEMPIRKKETPFDKKCPD
ncbi:MAG: hypothetical protein CNE97_04865 [alpha proteobacterium MED-G10]|nr:MAG: hypothetical protein CNE97_04865 [alpha proteobacterium MED-G10]